MFSIGGGCKGRERSKIMRALHAVFISVLVQLAAAQEFSVFRYYADADCDKASLVWTYVVNGTVGSCVPRQCAEVPGYPDQYGTTTCTTTPPSTSATMLNERVTTGTAICAEDAPVATAASYALDQCFPYTTTRAYVECNATAFMFREGCNADCSACNSVVSLPTGCIGSGDLYVQCCDLSPPETPTGPPTEPPPAYELAVYRYYKNGVCADANLVWTYVVNITVGQCVPMACQDVPGYTGQAGTVTCTLEPPPLSDTMFNERLTTGGAACDGALVNAGTYVVGECFPFATVHAYVDCNATAVTFREGCNADCSDCAQTYPLVAGCHGNAYYQCRDLVPPELPTQPPTAPPPAYEFAVYRYYRNGVCEDEFLVWMYAIKMAYGTCAPRSCQDVPGYPDQTGTVTCTLSLPPGSPTMFNERVTSGDTDCSGALVSAASYAIDECFPFETSNAFVECNATDVMFRDNCNADCSACGATYALVTGCNGNVNFQCRDLVPTLPTTPSPTTSPPTAQPTTPLPTTEPPTLPPPTTPPPTAEPTTPKPTTPEPPTVVPTTPEPTTPEPTTTAPTTLPPTTVPPPPACNTTVEAYTTLEDIFWATGGNELDSEPVSATKDCLAVNGDTVFGGWTVTYQGQKVNARGDLRTAYVDELDKYTQLTVQIDGLQIAHVYTRTVLLRQTRDVLRGKWAFGHGM